MNPKNGRLNVGSRWFLVAVLSLFLPALGQGQTAPTSQDFMECFQLTVDTMVKRNHLPPQLLMGNHGFESPPLRQNFSLSSSLTRRFS